MLHSLMRILKHYSTMSAQITELKRELAKERLKAKMAEEEFNHAYRKLTSEEQVDAYNEFQENEQFFWIADRLL